MTICLANITYFTYTRLPLLTRCEIHGLFHDFPELFQAKPGSFLFTAVFQISVWQYSYYINKLFIINFTQLAEPWQWKTTNGQKSGLAKSRFLFYTAVISKVLFKTISLCLLILEIKKDIFAHSRVFKDHDPNSRIFQGPAVDSMTFQSFQTPQQPCTY